MKEKDRSYSCIPLSYISILMSYIYICIEYHYLTNTKYSCIQKRPRHTFINRCYIKGVDRDIIKSIVGHEPDFTLDVYGGNPFTPKQLFQGISKVSYTKIRWDRLKVDWKDIIGE